MAEAVAPLLILFAVVGCLIRKKDIYPVFLDGVSDGIKTLIKILPPMVAVMSASAMLRESGILTLVVNSIAKILPFRVSEDILALSILRPISGGGSIGLLADILAKNGADSFAGRCASIICASSETSLYVIMVYFAQTRVTHTKKVLIAALFGDFVCILAANIICLIYY